MPVSRCDVLCCAVLQAWSAENVSQCHSVVLVELVPVRGRAEPITIVPAECSTWLVPPGPGTGLQQVQVQQTRAPAAGFGFGSGSRIMLAAMSTLLFLSHT